MVGRAGQGIIEPSSQETFGQSLCGVGSPAQKGVAVEVLEG